MFPLRKYLSKAVGALALVLTPGVAQADDHAVETAMEKRVNAPALWKLTDEDTTIYMFGTVHVLPDGVEWLDNRITTALEQSDELVTEIDMGELQANAHLMAGAAMIETGQTLRSMMTQDNRVEFEAALTGLGLSAGSFDMVEPWFASLNLSLLPIMQAGYNPASGVEMVLNGMSQGKQHTALETVADQVEMFDGMPLEMQLNMLDASVEAVPEVTSNIAAMVGEWLQGDAQGLAELMNDSVDDPALYQRMLVDRNANWVNWIENRMEAPGTVFMAVGAGHLAGEGSVQDLLTQRGLMVERIH